MENTVMDRGPADGSSRARTLFAVAAAISAAALWPGLAAAGVGDCVIGSGWGVPAASPQPGPEAQVLALTNVQRALNGVTPPLVISPTLNTAAEWKASHLASLSYFSHPDQAPYGAGTAGQPDRDPFMRDRVCGYPAAVAATATTAAIAGVAAGENVAFGQPTPQAVVDAWMASPGHRAAILSPTFVVIGVGAAQSSATGQMNWAETFGSLNDAAPAAATAVTLRSFSGTSARRGVMLRWRTASEFNTAGFRIYRESHGKRVRINAKLLASRSLGRTSAGHRYSFFDRHAPKKQVARYWLQSIDLDATKAWYGPARVAR